MDNQYFIYAVIIVGIFTAYMAVINIFRTDKLRGRVKSLAEGYAPEEVEYKKPAIAVFCELAVKMTGGDINNQKELTASLLQAGIQSPHGIAYFMFVRRIVQPILLVVGIVMFLQVVLFSASEDSSTRLIDLIIGLFFIVMGLAGANLYVSNRKQHRQAVLLRAFPELLDLLLVCIEAGLGLDAALARAGLEFQKTRPIVASEIDRTRLELTMLSDRVLALQNLAERTQIIPVKALVSALIQTEKFGTSLVDTLRVLSDDQRVTRLLNAENRAARLPVLITIPLILCIMPALFMVILGPAVVRVSDNGGLMGGANGSSGSRNR